MFLYYNFCLQCRGSGLYGSDGDVSWTLWMCLYIGQHHGVEFKDTLDGNVWNIVFQSCKATFKRQATQSLIWNVSIQSSRLKHGVASRLICRPLLKFWDPFQKAGIVRTLSLLPLNWRKLWVFNFRKAALCHAVGELIIASLNNYICWLSLMGAHSDLSVVWGFLPTISINCHRQQDRG